MRTLRLVFGQKLHTFKTWKRKHSKIWPFEIVGVLYLTSGTGNLYVEPEIRQSTYPESSRTGYPAGIRHLD
jgi:hypothetical protein